MYQKQPTSTFPFVNFIVSQYEIWVQGGGGGGGGHPLLLGLSAVLMHPGEEVSRAQREEKSRHLPTEAEQALQKRDTAPCQFLVLVEGQIPENREQFMDVDQPPGRALTGNRRRTTFEELWVQRGKGVDGRLDAECLVLRRFLT